MPHKFIISGGGTGGHIFPAIAIANEIKAREKDAEILFVGANGRMEMEKVPAAGYPIKGLNISGLKRSLSLSNLAVPFRLFRAVLESKKLLKSFRPDVVIGVGGYASSAVLYAASGMNIPSLIQEQNSYPGITNKWLSKRVRKICVAYGQMEKFFPADKLILTGNPVRQEIAGQFGKRREAHVRFKLNPDKFTLLVIGGSLGARSINLAIARNLKKFRENGIQLLWQTGSGYIEEARAAIAEVGGGDLFAFDFIREMDLAYAAADLVVSRAGAIAVSELCLVGKPAILVPYPHAAEDHQTHNALALVNREAALLIRDHQTLTHLGDAVLQLYSDEQKRNTLAENILTLAKPDAAGKITDEIYRLIR
jgi:UDP-N-acetylglucosamine--N-acetylmuramyl-(pentapeptide) pyrophosphoryl-undecaprenol N-acetylglucosamine transferase